MKIILKGTPPSISHIYKYRNAGKFIMGYMSKQGKDKKEEYRLEMINQWKKPILTEEFKIDVTYYFGDKRKRDWDNFNKLWMDAGSGIIWEDDKLISDAHVHKRYDKENPRVEVEIIEKIECNNSRA